jgi:thiamine kinase-like enzyme
VALFSLGAGESSWDAAERALVVGRAAPEHAARLGELGGRLAESLAAVPRGFAHGDFWAENLLADGNRLTGIVDWDYAGEGRPPVLDLFHLLVNEERRSRRLVLGGVIAGWLLPAARAGGTSEVTEYCQRIGLDVDSGLLTDLALAYWLDYVARQLELYADRAARPVWMRDNVSAILSTAI